MDDGRRTTEMSPRDIEFRGRIYDSIVETIGATPLVRLGRFADDAGITAELLAKLEFFNPLSSVKDRIGLAMIEGLEAAGRATPGKTVLVEPTPGRSEARRVGQEGFSTCRYRWAPYN